MRQILNQPQHDKINKMTCEPCEDSDQPGHPPSLISLHCPHEETLGPQLPIQCTAKTPIRLGGCPGLSESLLGAQVILLSFVVLRLKLKIWNDTVCFPKLSALQTSKLACDIHTNDRYNKLCFPTVCWGIRGFAGCIYVEFTKHVNKISTGKWMQKHKNRNALQIKAPFINFSLKKKMPSQAPCPQNFQHTRPLKQHKKKL